MTTTSTLSARTVAALVRKATIDGFRFVSYGESVQVVRNLGVSDEAEATLLAFLSSHGFTVGEDDLGYPTITR